MRTVRTRFMPLLAAGLLLMATAAGCRTQPRDEDLTASAPDAGDSASSSESSADYQPQQVTDPFGQETLTEEALGEDAL
ncbi:MAG: hypothetical protein O7A07_06815, partial [Acidobacteria bacterium]|nr:hypothetical protein [Acidobacteriota bacterium]